MSWVLLLYFVTVLDFFQFAWCSRWELLSKPFALPSVSTDFLFHQVPGDGSCLFHSIGVSLLHKEDSCIENQDRNRSISRKGYDKALSLLLRYVAVDMLATNTTLSVSHGQDNVTSSDILSLMQLQYNTSSSEYLRCMRDERYWGGGPELLVLSELLQLPICVYELATVGILWKSLCKLFLHV